MTVDTPHQAPAPPPARATAAPVALDEARLLAPDAAPVAPVIRSDRADPSDSSDRRRWSTALGSELRFCAAAAAVVAAAAHVPVTGTHLTEVPYVGWLFVALGLAFVAAAAALVVRDSPAAWSGAATVAVAAVVGYALSRGPGLPGMDDDVGDWTDQLGLIAVGAETLVVALALVALRRLDAHDRRAVVAAATGSVLLLSAATYLLGIATSGQ